MTWHADAVLAGGLLLLQSCCAYGVLEGGECVGVSNLAVHLQGRAACSPYNTWLALFTMRTVPPCWLVTMSWQPVPLPAVPVEKMELAGILPVVLTFL